MRANRDIPEPLERITEVERVRVRGRDQPQDEGVVGDRDDELPPLELVWVRRGEPV